MKKTLTVYVLGIIICLFISSQALATSPFVGTPNISGTKVTQTLIAAGNDINKTGDIYVFTASQFWDGSKWFSTEVALKFGVTLGTHTINYDVEDLAADTYPPHIFLEALGGHIEDGGVIYTRLRDQDLDVFKEVLERYGISEWT